MIFAFVQKLKNRFKDIQTMTTLCQNAEDFSRQEGDEKPGVEHFVLAALTLEDGSAQRVMKQFEVDVAHLQRAIQQQHADALQKIGLDNEILTLETQPITSSKPLVYPAKSSVQELIQSLATNNKSRCTPLLGVHILEAALNFEHGTLARSLKWLNITPSKLRVVINKELAMIQEQSTYNH